MRRLSLSCLLLFLPLTTQAFFQYDQAEGFVEARGLVHALGLAANNPNDRLVYDDDKILGGAVSVRLMLDAAWRDWQLELHAVQGYQQSELLTGGRRFSALRDVERSDALDWHFANERANLAFDRLNLQYGRDNLNLKFGRQPINLASSFYFTPNDFFAPFAAQTFYRTYKAGVDAVRADWQWQDLSQLTVMAVLDYPTDQHRVTGWQNAPDWSRTAYLVRASHLIGNAEWGLILAQIDNDAIVGFDYQGELWGWLGVRGEGHSRFYDEDNQARDTKLSLSFEYRPDAYTSLRLEQFYQRRGATDKDDYATLTTIDTSSIYLARHYTALGLSYELSPLLNTEVLTLFNHTDQSALFAFYATYSLSDESELAFGINLPVGEAPRQSQLQTEFGSFPKTLTAEMRIYF